MASSLSLENLKEILDVWRKLTPATEAEEGTGYQWYYFADALEQFNERTGNRYSHLDYSHVRYILVAAGVIATPGVRGDSAVRSIEPTTRSDTIIQYCRVLLSALKLAEGLSFSVDQQSDFMQRQRIEPGLFEDTKRLLTLLGLARRVQRSGALQYVEPAAPRELHYYDYARELLIKKLDNYDNIYNAQTLGFRVTQSGGAGGTLRKGPGAAVPGGEYMTPDVVGYHILKAESLQRCVVRAYSVEVKLALNLTAVAEAEAHRRFAHFVYLLAPQSFLEIDPVVKLAAAAKGIGIMSRVDNAKKEIYIQLESALHAPDPSEVDAMFRDVPSREEGDDQKKLSELIAETLKNDGLGSPRLSVNRIVI